MIQFPRFVVAMFEADWIEGENDPKGQGPLSLFAYSCAGQTHKTSPLSLRQQLDLAADLEEFMRDWLAGQEGLDD